METQESKIIEVSMGDTKEDIKARETIISNVYRSWYEANPSKAVYNSHLKDYINVRFLSINETVHHASMSYLSTLAVLQLDLILEMQYRLVNLRGRNPTTKTKASFRR